MYKTFAEYLLWQLGIKIWITISPFLPYEHLGSVPADGRELSLFRFAIYPVLLFRFQKEAVYSK